MGTSTLIHSDEEPPITDRGHGIDALGPSDSSDTGSDLIGAIGRAEHTEPDLRREGRDEATGGVTPEAMDLGGVPISSDSDAEGTGERASAGDDGPAREAQDISVDRIVSGAALGISGNSADLEGLDDPETLD